MKRICATAVVMAVISGAGHASTLDLFYRAYGQASLAEGTEQAKSSADADFDGGTTLTVSPSTAFDGGSSSAAATVDAANMAIGASVSTTPSLNEGFGLLYGRASAEGRMYARYTAQGDGVLRMVVNFAGGWSLEAGTDGASHAFSIFACLHCETSFGSIRPVGNGQELAINRNSTIGGFAEMRFAPGRGVMAELPIDTTVPLSGQLNEEYILETVVSDGQSGLIGLNLRVNAVDVSGSMDFFNTLRARFEVSEGLSVSFDDSRVSSAVFRESEGATLPSVIPLPASAWLLLSGLGGFALFGRLRGGWNSAGARQRS